MYHFRKACHGRPHSHHAPHAGPPGWGCGDHPMGRHPDEVEGGFGVRRPLRFLADRLGLDEAQVTALARILDDLKTERAQAAVDGRRSLAEFADAVTGEAFDAAKAEAAGARRVQSAEKLRDAVSKALTEIHALLRPDQRGKMAYLIRTGALTM